MQYGSCYGNTSEVPNLNTKVKVGLLCQTNTSLSNQIKILYITHAHKSQNALAFIRFPILIPCSTNMVIIIVTFFGGGSSGVFSFLFQFSTSWRRFFNRTITPFVLVG